MNVTKALFKWLDLPWLNEVEEFVRSHIKKTIDKPWSTTRKVGSRIAAWKSGLIWPEISHIQDVCNETMQQFNYLPVSQQQLVKDATFGDFPLFFVPGLSLIKFQPN